MRIIFLDVDGVLNNDKTEDRYQGFTGIDQQNVDTLKKLYDKSNEEEITRIVVSSSWRYEMVKKYSKADGSYEYLLKRLNDSGMEVIDYTPMSPISGWHRSDEIEAWLSDNKTKFEVSTYVILDDESFDFRDKGLDTKFVWTDGEYGLTDKDIDRGLEILRGGEPKLVNPYYEEEGLYW